MAMGVSWMGNLLATTLGDMQETAVLVFRMRGAGNCKLAEMKHPGIQGWVADVLSKDNTYLSLLILSSFIL